MAIKSTDLIEQQVNEIAIATLANAGALRRADRPDNPTVSVIVPTLNEARNLPFALWRLPDCVTEVVIVDGRSTDDTIEIGGRLRADVRIVEEKKKGKGVALKRGFEEATGDIIVMLDADGSADSAEIQAFVDALVSGADFAKGSRFLPGGGSVDITPIRDLGNKTLTATVNMVCQTRYTDLCYGYNAFWKDCLEFIPVDVSGFEVETRLNMLVASSGLAVVEVPSHEFLRVHGSSNLNTIRDGLRVLRTIVSTAVEIRSGRQSVRSAIPNTLNEAVPGDNKTMFVVAGKAPAWVNEHTRHSAEQMTEMGRVLVGFTDCFRPSMMLPGDVGGSTLLSIAPTGYPVWTGRTLASLGLRRRQKTIVIVKFDTARPLFLAASALISRLRREHVVVQDLTIDKASKRSLAARVGFAALGRLANESLKISQPEPETGNFVAYAACGDDLEFAVLIVDSVSAMSQNMADSWRIVLRSDDADVHTLVASSNRSHMISVESSDDELEASDVVIVRHGRADDVVMRATELGASTIIVDHPVAQRVGRRFDGTWLARSDVSSFLVALESCRGINEGQRPSMARIRDAAEKLVASLKESQR